MKKPSAIVVFPCIIHSDPEVIQHCWIHIQHGSINTQYVDIDGDGVDCQAQIALACTQSLFSLFSIIDVGKEQIPRGYLIFRISNRETANLEPSVNAIRT